MVPLPRKAVLSSHKVSLGFRIVSCSKSCHPTRWAARTTGFPELDMWHRWTWVGGWLPLPRIGSLRGYVPPFLVKKRKGGTSWEHGREQPLAQTVWRLLS